MKKCFLDYQLSVFGLGQWGSLGGCDSGCRRLVNHWFKSNIFCLLTLIQHAQHNINNLFFVENTRSLASRTISLLKMEYLFWEWSNISYDYFLRKPLKMSISQPCSFHILGHGWNMTSHYLLSRTCVTFLCWCTVSIRAWFMY